jgi:3'(2'), 5'-bisphosphate nucleotidase
MWSALAAGVHMSLPPIDLLALLQKIRPMVLEAGKLILAFDQTKAYQIREKPDGTPVTDADQAAHDSLTRSLLQLFPQIPIVSEENAAPTTENYPLYWCMDPLDGTKEFIRGTHGEYTVNVALIWEGTPILGVVYVPLSQELFYAASKQGAFRQVAFQNPVQIYTRKFPSADRIWLVSRSYDPEKLERLQRAWNFTLMPMSSSLKHCRIAQGHGDLYLRKGPTGQWDTAATQCIVVEAGGKVVDLYRKIPLRYEATRAENPHLAICGDPTLDLSALDSEPMEK